MPSTYDSLLRLELQTIGENADTWGNKLNDNYSLVADAIAGYTSISIAGSGTYTLSVANAPTVDEARKAFIAFTGALLGARTIIIPSSSKVYFMRLATTGDYSVTVKTATGTGVVLSASNVNCIVCDGTDCYFASETNRVSRAGDTMTGGLTIAAGDLTVSTGNIVATAGNVNAQAGKLTEGGYSLIPPGMIMPYAGSSAPGGWVFCAGQSLNRVTYAALFSAIGTTYGADDSLTFKVPDLRGRVAVGRDNMGGSAASRITSGGSSIDGTVLGAAGGDELSQNHTHTLTDSGHTHSVTDPTHTHTNTVTSSGNHTHTYGRAIPVSGPVLAGSASGYQLSYPDTLTSAAGDHTHTVTIAAASTGISIVATGANVVSSSITMATSGLGNSQNVQPSIILNYLIKV